MSYLNQLKQHLAGTEADNPDQTCGGFEGGRSTAFSSKPHSSEGFEGEPDRAFSTEKKERKLKNQFYRQKLACENRHQPVDIAGEIPLPPKPSEPSKAPYECFEGESYDIELWRRKFYGLNSYNPPCLGFRPGEWPRIFDAAHDFLERHAEAAHALGWSTLDLFGVHRTVGATRVDCCGALMLSGPFASSVEADCIRFGHLTYYRRPADPEAVPVWELVR